MRPFTACILSLTCVLGACASPRETSGADLVLSTSLLKAPMQDTSGRPLVLADVLASNETVALVFWQAWCAPCRAEAPALVSASRQHPEMEIVGVVSGPDEAVDGEALQDAIHDLGLPYRTVRDRSLELTEALDVRGTPTIVVLDKNGRVLYQGHEVPDWETLR
jgi:thiol-disulfide isomerase/thioredoxin